MRALVLVLSLAACASPRRPAPAAPVAPLDDPHADRLNVGLRIGRSHARSLRDGASAGLARIPFAVLMPTSRGGDVELQVDVARVAVIGNETVCGIKILVLRLPQQDLLGMAEGNARAGGTHAQAGNDCIAQLGESLISGKVRTLLHRRLDEKR